MDASEHTVRFAPGVIRSWLEIEPREARQEVYEIVESLPLTGIARRTSSLLEGRECRTYGRFVKLLLHRNEARALIASTGIALP